MVKEIERAEGMDRIEQIVRQELGFNFFPTIFSFENNMWNTKKIVKHSIEMCKTIINYEICFQTGEKIMFGRRNKTENR